MQFECGHCGNKVASASGYRASSNGGRHHEGSIYICPNCALPTIVVHSFNLLMPRPKPGESVAHLPPEVERIYEEARSAFQAAAFTGCVMLCRKLLMNIAVAQGASPKDLTFNKSVEWLDSENYIPKGGKGWVSEIKKLGNEANHELPPISDADAADILDFTVMLLKTIYDYPGRMRSKASP